VSSKWPELSLGDVCELKYGKSLPEGERTGKGFGVFGSNGEVGRHEQALTAGATIVVGRKGSFGEVTYSAAPCWPIDTTYYVDASVTAADLRWLYHRMKALPLTQLNRAAAIPGLNRDDAYAQRLLLPPIEEQRRIAGVLDAADALRSKRKQVLDRTGVLIKSIFVDMFGDPVAAGTSSTRTLSEVVSFVGGGTPSKTHPEYFQGDICWATSKDMRSRFLEDTQDHITEAAIAASATKLVPSGSVLVVVKSKVLAHTLPVAITRVPTCFGQDLKALTPLDGTTPEFVAWSLRIVAPWLLQQARGVNTEGLTLVHLRATPVPMASRTEVAAFSEAARAVEVRQAVIEESRCHFNALFSSLQQRAFRGEL